MTTNARDENWSDWVPVSGPDDMPTDEDMFGQWKGDDGFVSSETKLCDVGYSSSFRTVVAYRYKIKEPDSDMHPDLQWLARNVSEWGGTRYVTVEQGGELLWTSKPMNTGDSYCESQWLKARRDLGLDQPAGKLNKCLDNAWDEPTPEEDEAWQAKEQKQNKTQYSAYFKDVRHIDTLDVYRVVSLFDCEKHGHPISHAAKKLLLSGSRTGGKDVESDVREAIDTLHRWIEMREEDTRA